MINYVSFSCIMQRWPAFLQGQMKNEAGGLP